VTGAKDEYQQTVYGLECSERLGQEDTRNTEIGRGVSQGCCLSPILFNLYNEYLTKKALEGFGDFKIGHVICTVKYVENTKVMRISREPSPVQIMTDQKQLVNVEFFYLGSLRTSDARCTHEIN
jgi:hypothetical protein